MESSQKEQIKKDSTSASNPTNNENDSMCSQTISQIQKMSVTSDLQVFIFFEIFCQEKYKRPPGCHLSSI